MPDWKTHLIFSLFFIIVILFLLQRAGFALEFWELAWILSLSILAALFPDVDIKSSKIRTYTSVAVSFLACLWYLMNFHETWYYAPAYFGLLYLILKYLPTKHRGITHTFAFAVLFSAVMTLIYLALHGMGIAIGLKGLVLFITVFSNYALHLVLDRV